MITITTFNSTYYIQSATEMALLFEQLQVFGIINVYDNNLHELAGTTTTIEMASFNDWINRHGVARLTIILPIQLSIPVEYRIVNEVKTHWEWLALAYKSMLKLTIFQIREVIWLIKQQDCGYQNKYTLQINRIFKDLILCAQPSFAVTDVDMDTAKTVTKMSDQDHIIYLVCGNQRNDVWKGFL